MDFSNDIGEPWEWQDEEYCLQKGSHLDMSHCLWDELKQNEEDLSYMFEVTTPIKACGDLAYHIADSGKNMTKELEGCRQVKRRRMLRFDTDVIDPYLCNEQIPSTFIESKDREYSIEEALPEISEWVSELTEDISASGNEGLSQASDRCLANCFNGAEMHFGSDDMNVSGVSADQVDISEFCNFPLEVEAHMMQGCSTPTPQIVFKGRKSYMQTPTKLASSVAYPFALIKPSGVHGNVTLKDINQRIRTPPPSKSKPNSDDDASSSYPTSAFSGKPVVVKTKICTEGGKGSITIMRTKG